MTSAPMTISHPTYAPYQPEGAPTPQELTPNTPSRSLANRILLGATAVCSVLSVIPPLRLGAGLALRSISCLSIFSSSLSSAEQGWTGELVKTGKVVAAVLGIAGLAAALPAMMIVSLAIDLALQLYECCRNFLQGENAQAIMHLAMILTGALSLVGFATGGWGYILAALLANACIMFGFAALSAGTKRFEEAFCFGILGVASLVGGILSAEMKRPVKTVTISPRDSSDKIIVQTGLQGKIIAEGLPGQDVTIHDNTRITYTVLHSNSQFTTRSTFKVPTEIIQHALCPALFGAMPVTTPAIHAVTQNIPTEKELVDAIEKQKIKNKDRAWGRLSYKASSAMT